MKTKNIQQEILFFTTTSFSKREWCEKDESKKDNSSYSQQEQLEKACWDGILDEMFPELMPPAPLKKRLFMWQISVRRTFLSVELAEYRNKVEQYFSIDPYLFTRVFHGN